ncbi:terminase large subunit domain-containing protein [Rhizobium leguminosarum]|uniref:terminase large subunit domain-containing protein n=1 Tax=Rhizobium leguminosarum TaxID=384 RepID=UPI001607EEE5|nr:terminase family protein [Rhizobium leguminosarum]MBB4345149.1 phage FluMu gp28-like protein [Rhizobium leguminosarum]MBB6298220.1 phage FluMu gp28-like protein [Rhizobium leguminosarum]
MENFYTYNRPTLYQKQSDAFFNADRYSWIEGSTKSGKTVSCMAWLFEQALFLGKEGREFWWVAPVSGQAEIAFNRMKRGIPKGIIRGIISSQGAQTITLINGAVLRFKSGEKPDNLYGEDVWAAVLDEASRMRAEAFYAVRSTLTATRGPVRIIGNVKGRKNWFFLGCRKAEGGEPGHSYHKITALDAVAAGVFPQEELDDARRALPDAVFRELYLCEPSDDGGNPFGLQFIRQNIAQLSNKAPAVFGDDLAKSVDWTVLHGLDEDGVTCSHTRFQLPWENTIDHIKLICGSTYTLLDSTGVGDPIVERLQKTGSNFEGFKFSAPSKQMLMEGLAVAIQRGEVQYPDGVIVSELESFEYEYTRTGVRYSAPEGSHDDCVMALALAVHAKNTRPAQPQVIAL